MNNSQAQRYLSYIDKAGGVFGVRTDYFDEDWQPIGPQVRGTLAEKGLVNEFLDPEGTSFIRLSHTGFNCIKGTHKI